MTGTKIIVQTMLFLIKKNLLSNMFLSGELWLEISAITFASQVMKRFFLFISLFRLIVLLDEENILIFPIRQIKM